MAIKMVIPIRVRNYHIDAYGHVNNAQYLTLLEEARTQFLERVGLPFEEMYHKGLFIIINEVYIKFKKPALLGDHLDVFVWFPIMKRAKVTFRQEIRKAGSGELVAIASVSGGFVLNNRVIPIPEDFFRIMQDYYIPD